MKCAHCGKHRMHHNAITKACPIGGRTRIGYVCYSAKNKFKPFIPKTEPPTPVASA